MDTLVATKHEVTEDAAKKDWGKRRDWIKFFNTIDDAKTLGLQLLHDYELAILDAENLYEQTDDPKTKIQILWFRLKSIKQKQDFLNEVGGLRRLQSSFLEKFGEHQREMEEKKYPQLNGEKDPFMRAMITSGQL